jgi:hypothetical protein
VWLLWVGGVGIICLHLSRAGPSHASQVATCSPNQLSYAKSFLVFFLHKMNFEDVEERDGVYSVLSCPGGLISYFFQEFDCRGMFGPHLALRPIAP